MDYSKMTEEQVKAFNETWGEYIEKIDAEKEEE